MRQTTIAKTQGLENPFYGKETDDANLAKPSENKKLEIAKRTAEALGVRVSARTEAAYVTSSAFKRQEADKFIKFKPKNEGDAGAKERMIRVTTQESDPMQPPRFKHKRIPQGIPSPPPAIIHSPSRKLTAKDQQNLKIPPCISNWKNAKGHTIPLHMRLMADGRNIQDLAVNSRFGAFSEALYTAEREARKEIDERNRILTNIELAETLRAENDMRTAAIKARDEKLKIMASNISSVAHTDRIRGNEDSMAGRKRSDTEEGLTAAQKEREAIRNQKKYEIKREHRIAAAQKKKAKITRDSDREITERIALGVAQPTGKDTLYDQRLFNQSAGVEAGFGDEDDYTVYDKPLFTDRSAAALYKIKSGKDDQKGNEGVKKMIAKHQQPARGFEGADKEAGEHEIQFEKKDVPQIGSKKADDSASKDK